MRVKISNVNRFFTLVLLFGAVGAMSVISVQYALAMPDPSPSGLGGEVIKDFAITLEIREANNPGSSTIGDQIYIFSQAKADPTLILGPIGIVSGITCASDGSVATSGGVIVDPVWRLEKSGAGNMRIGYIFDDNGPGIGDEGVITMTFGTSDPNPTEVFANADAELTISGASIGVQGDDLSVASGLGLGRWTDTTGAAAPDTGTGAGLPRTMSIVTCGVEGSAYSAGGDFDIVLPVGGTLVPISMTSLLLAGISASAIWLVPLAVAAGGALALLKFQVSRKE